MTERVNLPPALRESLVAYQQRRFDLFTKSFVLVVGQELKARRVPQSHIHKIAQKLRDLWLSFRAELATTPKHEGVLNEVPAEFAELLAEIGHPHA
jgi:hypothetical protein